jgi:hypothetical protein
MRALGAFLLAATSAVVAIPNRAQAGTGLLWLDSAYVLPVNHVRHSQQWKRLHHARMPAPSSIAHAVPRSRPEVLEVASAAPPRIECFWCNARITGLSF